MPIDNVLWCARIGMFSNSFKLISQRNSNYKPGNSLFDILSDFKSHLISILPLIIVYQSIISLFLLIYIFFSLTYAGNISSFFHESPVSCSLKCISSNVCISYYGKPLDISTTSLSQTLLLRSGDVELNPEPKKSSSLSFFHWNVNGIAAHDFSKLALQSHAISHNIFI